MDALDLFTSFDGRIGRKIFWLATAAIAGIEFVVLLVAIAMGDLLAEGVVLIFLYPQFVVSIKRAHDRDMPAWMVSAFFAFSVVRDALMFLGWDLMNVDSDPATLAINVAYAVYGLAILFELGFRRGTAGPNRHGPDPLGGH
jgi:uncharacterized membrane protein YhaH (DUF805 family)